MLAGVGGVDACIFRRRNRGLETPARSTFASSACSASATASSLTKVGHVDDELATIAQMEIADRTEGTFLADAPIVPVGAIDGHGIDDLNAALDHLLDVTPRQGMTRSLACGSIAVRGQGRRHGRHRNAHRRDGAGRGRAVRARSTPPSGSRVAEPVRRPHEGRPGNRVAANLSGVSHDQLLR